MSLFLWKNMYYSKTPRFSGTDDKEVYSKARLLYFSLIQNKKRRPYIRSVYFDKDKIFIDTFWQHMHQKNRRDRNRRMRYLPCAIELIRNSHFHPVTVQNPNKPQEILHRFEGITLNKESFCVQVKEHKRTGEKSLMSIFPL